MKRLGWMVLGAFISISWVSPASAHGFHGTVSDRVTAVFASVTALGFTFAIRTVGKVELRFSQYVVICLTLITALIHLLEGARLMQYLDYLFLLSGAGYLVLLSALFIPLGFLAGLRQQAGWALIGFTIINIIAFFAVHPWGMSGGKYELLGLVTKQIELALMGVLLIERSILRHALAGQDRRSDTAGLLQERVKP